MQPEQGGREISVMGFSAFLEQRRRVDYYLRPTGERKSLYEETRKTSEILRRSAQTEALASRRLQEVSFVTKKDESLFLRCLLMKNLFCL